MASLTVPNYGLLQGLADGLKQGLISYQTQKNIQHDQQMQEILANAHRDESGNLQPNEGLVAQRQAGLLKSQHDIAGYDPNSDLSKNSISFANQGLRAAIPGSKIQVPEGSSYADINGENSTLGKLVTGGLGMQGAQLKAQSIGAGIQGRNDIARDNQTSAARDKVVNDSQLKLHTQRIQGANRIQQQLDDIKQGKIVDTNQFLGDLNTEYVNLLTGSNNAALGKLERTEYRATAGDIAGLIQRISGSPQSIHSPEILNQLETSVSGLKQTYQKNVDARALQLARTYAHNSDATNAIMQAVQDMINTNGTGSYNQGLIQQPQHVQTQSQQPPGGHQNVIQNGHTYQWNPQTGKYE